MIDSHFQRIIIINIYIFYPSSKIHTCLKEILPIQKKSGKSLDKAVSEQIIRVDNLLCDCQECTS